MLEDILDNLWNAEIHLSKYLKQWKNEELSQHKHLASPKIKIFTWSEVQKNQN